MRKLLPWSLVLALAFAVPCFAGQAAAAKSAQAPAAAPVNLNTASEADLIALPGVGPATAKKIIAGRPYSSVADLSKAGVSKSTIGKISSLVTAGGGAAAPAAMPAPKPAPAPAPAPAAMPAPKPAPAPAAAPSAKPAAASTMTPQMPPEKGMVWVNLSTKVFHREGDKYYGATKNGKFMTEADAVKAGYREAKMGGKKK